MERIQGLNPERIRWCCQEYGITEGQLAADLGISRTTMDRVMAREEGLTFNQLSKLATYLGRGVLFFLELEPINEEQVHSAEFRTLANQKPELSPRVKALIERAERQRAVYLSLREDLDDESRPRFIPPDIAGGVPRDAARIARTWLNLEQENTFDAYRAAVEARGLLVFQSNGYAGKWQIAKDNPILGFALWDATCPLIVVKRQNAQSRQTFTLMHELGHLLLHRASSIDDEEDLYSHMGHERDANAFAGHLLVPDEFLANLRNADRPADVSQYDDWLAPQRKAWGVSTEVILRRLLDSGRLPRESYEGYRAWRRQQPERVSETGSRLYRHREPKHVFGDTFVRTVLDALNAKQITLTKASKYLDSLKIKDLHALEQHYAGI